MLGKLKRYIKRKNTDIVNPIKAKGKVKYFCIGRNKTGTTYLKRAFEDLGYPVGNQRTAEVLTGKYYFKDSFQPIVDYCKTAP